MKTYAQICLERANNVTDGPWYYGHMDEDYPFADIDSAEGAIAENVHLENASFIIHSRIDVVELANRLNLAIGTIKALVDNGDGDCYGAGNCAHCKAILILEELKRPLE